MDFIDRIKALAASFERQLEHIKTEEATKHSMIMPFIQLMGYNVFDPTEVVPEFTADHGVKKGEKVDYAIIKDGKPIILIEAKWTGHNLADTHFSQLYRYFTVTHARIAILTNGIDYRFYTDIEESNKMDKTPFLTFDIREIRDTVANELKKLTRDNFDVDEVLNTAHDLKYMNAIKSMIGSWFKDPDEDIVKFICGKIYSGRVTEKIKQQFVEIIKRAFRQFLNEQMSDRLQIAIKPADETPGEPSESEPETNEQKDGNQIVTTVEEIEGYHIVKSICREVVDPEMITHRDTINYMGILFDDNNRKPVCRLHFNSQNKRIGLFDENKKETRHPIETLDDIYGFAKQLQKTISFYQEK